MGSSQTPVRLFLWLQSSMQARWRRNTSKTMDVHVRTLSRAAKQSCPRACRVNPWNLCLHNRQTKWQTDVVKTKKTVIESWMWVFLPSLSDPKYVFKGFGCDKQQQTQLWITLAVYSVTFLDTNQIETQVHSFCSTWTIMQSGLFQLGPFPRAAILYWK